MAMSKSRVAVLLIFISSCCQVSLGLKKLENNTYYRFSPNRFGPYYATSKSLTFCKPAGPVDKEHYVYSTVHVVKISRLDEEYRGYGIVRLDTKIHKFIWDVSLLRGGIKIPIYRTESLNPCADLMFSSLMSYFLNQSRNCLVKQGNYTVSGMNVNTLAHKVAGDNFIHETFFSYFEVFSTNGSLFCANNMYETKPLKRVRKH